MLLYDVRIKYFKNKLYEIKTKTIKTHCKKTTSRTCNVIEVGASRNIMFSTPQKGAPHSTIILFKEKKSKNLLISAGFYRFLKFGIFGEVRKL